jgi:hypothetical protein
LAFISAIFSDSGDSVFTAAEDLGDVIAGTGLGDALAERAKKKS